MIILLVIVVFPKANFKSLSVKISVSPASFTTVFILAIASVFIIFLFFK